MRICLDVMGGDHGCGVMIAGAKAALAAGIPSRTQDFVMLDVGANAVCEPSHLAQFAIMGSIYAREILGKPKPRVGVLSNGSEDMKGTELTREAARLCGQLELNFV